MFLWCALSVTVQVTQVSVSSCWLCRWSEDLWVFDKMSSSRTSTCRTVLHQHLAYYNPSPPKKKKKNTKGWGGGVTLESLHSSVRLSICLCVRLCPLSISWTAEPFLTKLGMLVYYHGMECHVEKLVHCLQCQGHTNGLQSQNMTISTIPSKLLVWLHSNLVW